MSDGIAITDCDAATTERVRRELLAALRGSLRQTRNDHIALAAWREPDELVGGLSADVSYGWIHIDVLWVAAGQRGQGIGRQLLRAAERRARSLGCHSAWLDTSNPDARAFYRKLGYTAFGTLSNRDVGDPDEHRRWFLRKPLTAADQVRR